MRSLTRMLVCGLVVIGFGLATSGPAAAGGPGSSAGNSQYIDPLHNPGSSHKSGHGSGSGPSSHGSSGSSSSSSSSGSSTLSPSAPSGVSGSSTSSSGSSQATGRTLPFTGLNLGACVALGLGLLLAGLGLRRVLAAAR